jgi:hypothetical protein
VVGCWEPAQWPRGLTLARLQVLALAPFVCFLLLYWKRRAWSFLETQKIFYRTAKGREPPAAASATKPADASK